MTYTTIGFDPRRPSSSWLNEWSPDRRQTYLLQPDLAVPLSVDPMAWPPRLIHHELERRRPDEILLADWSLVNPVGLVRELAALDHYRTAATADDLTLAVCLLDPVADPWTDRLTSWPTQPPRPAADWVLLGHDVADDDLTSGLCNCGYTPEEATAARDAWAADLNQHGLFSDPERARAFAHFTNQRVREHAPFHVHGLFLVPTAVDSH